MTTIDLKEQVPMEVKTPNPYRFESLGSNCEFGFYQMHRGHNASTLFKWAGYPTLFRLQNLLDANFDNLLAEENTVPFNHEVAIDLSYDVGWHAPFATKLIDERGSSEVGNLAYIKTSGWSSAFEAFQKGMRFLINDFRSSIARVSKILVLKDLENVDDEQIFRLSDTLRDLGARASFMVVRQADDAHPPGSFRELEMGVIIFWIARFAPGHHVQTFCAASWDQACWTALHIFDAKPARPSQVSFFLSTSHKQSGKSLPTIAPR